jgi:hypothetical protein
VRLLVAVSVFIVTSVAVVCITVVVLALGTTAEGGLVFAVLWGFAAVILSRLADEGEARHRVWWAIGGLLLGPLVAAWLSWRYAGVSRPTS